LDYHNLQLSYPASSSRRAYLGKLDAAELSARKFQQVDKAHTRPDIALLLANILTGKHQYANTLKPRNFTVTIWP
jgi:hypothetical protein